MSMAACNIVRMYTDAMPKSGSTLIRSGDRWRNAMRADNAGAERVRRADERCSRVVLAVGRLRLIIVRFTQLWRKQMSDVAKKIRTAALIAVVIPAALVAACAPQPAPAPPPPQQPVA